MGSGAPEYLPGGPQKKNKFLLSFLGINIRVGTFEQKLLFSKSTIFRPHSPFSIQHCSVLKSGLASLSQNKYVFLFVHIVSIQS